VSPPRAVRRDKRGDLLHWSRLSDSSSACPATRIVVGLERVLIVPVVDRQVERHCSRTRGCVGGREVGNSHTKCVSLASGPPEKGATPQMSPTNTNPGRAAS